MNIDKLLINTTEVLQMLQKIRKWVYLVQPDIYSKLSGVFNSIFAKFINKNAYQNTFEAYFNQFNLLFSYKHTYFRETSENFTPVNFYKFGEFFCVKIWQI